MATLTPLRYPGGKDKTYKHVKELVNLNKCTTYIEPFAGGAGVAIRLLLNKDVNKIYINDYDYSIYSLWKSIINYSEELIAKIEETNITIEEWHKQKFIQENYKNNDNYTELDIGFSTLFLNRTNRSGIIKAGVIGGKEQKGIYKLDCRFNKSDIINRITRIASCSKSIIISNKDAKDFIVQDIVNTENSFTFFDPPYYLKGPGLYTNFYNHDDHVQLAETINTNMVQNHWILTYDISEEIKELYKTKSPIKYYLNYSIAKPSKGQEYMFSNPKTSINYNYLNLVYDSST